MKSILPFSMLIVLLTCTMADHENYLFVEIEHDYISKLIGTKVTCGTIEVDMPMYSYNSLNGALDIYHKFNMEDSTKYLIGNSYYFYGPVASGASSHINQFNIDTLIDTMLIEFSNKNDILKIYFNENGIINVNYKDSIFTLLNIKDSLLIQEVFNYQRDSCSYEISHKIIIRNQGYINSNNIKLHYKEL